MTERRHHPRYPRQLRVRCKNSQLAFEGLIRDICAGGVFIITSQLLPPDTSINLEISFAGDEPAIHCRGRIVWVNMGQVETFPPGFGVEFVEEDEPIMERLLEDLDF